MYDFKLGDEVRVMYIDPDDNYEGMEEYIGKYGFILYVPQNTEEGFYLVEFDELEDSEFYGRELELVTLY